MQFEEKNKLPELTEDIVKIAFSVLGNPKEAEYVTNIVILKLLKAKTTIRDIRSVIWKTTINACRDFLKRKSKERKEIPYSQLGTEDTDFIESIGKREITPSEAEEVELNDFIELVLSLLPWKYEMIIRLKYFEQMTYREIAKSLSISVPLAKVRVSRAIKRLREIITEYGWDNPLVS